MRIAFYAPMKPPDHPTPSGERQMARQLIRALEHADFRVEVATRLRTYSRAPAAEMLARAGAAEADRLLSCWRNGEAPRPDLWFTYHPYYKSPDFVGPRITRALGIPYVTAEASHAGKRDRDPWQGMQAHVADAVRQAQLNICFTEVDREGLARIVSDSRLARIPPFIDVAPFLRLVPRPASARPVKLVTVAMMREDVKLESYLMLAKSLAAIVEEPWTLTVVGDGPVRAAVERAFGYLSPDRLSWSGELPPDRIPAVLANCDVFAWPGIGEAYGLVFLEAQAAGLPVVALNTHGVPAVVRHGETGLLVESRKTDAYAHTLLQLIRDGPLRGSMGLAAHRFVLGERSIEAAACSLREMLAPLTARARA